MKSINKIILKCINEVLSSNSIKPLDKITNNLNLQKDIGLDSLDLAELTVRIESVTGVDIFENRIVTTIKEIKEQINLE